MGKNIRYKIAVGQLGGRMYYGIPSILYKHDLLSTLYTDFVLNKFPFSLISNVKSLNARRAPLPPKMIKQMVWQSFFHQYKIYKQKDILNVHKEFYRFGICLEKKIIKDNFNNSQAIIMIGSVSEHVLKEAKKRGLITIKEQIIVPAVFIKETLKDAWLQFPDWEDVEKEKKIFDLWESVQTNEWDNADYVICGSRFVAEVIRKLGGPYEKTFVIPYGVPLSSQIKDVKQFNQNRKLRVLSIGNISLRKGTPYIIEAARKLSSICEFKLVGSVPDRVKNILKSLPDNITLTGHVARILLKDYFEWADVFILPSLSEGSATVCYEALSFGLPLVVTPNSGQFFTHMKEGVYIEPKSVDAIVDALTFFVNNPSQVSIMSANALVLSKEASFEAYEKRIIDFLNTNIL